MTTCEISPITITLMREVGDWDLLRLREGVKSELFDVLMHGHWLQGTLRDWRSESDSAALVQDIERLFPFTNPQWAHA